MELEMQKYYAVESSFQKIKTCTGNSDVQEIVHKFLTREQTYATLLTAVSEAEKKMEDYKTHYDNKSEELNDLKINLESRKEKAKGNRSNFDDCEEIIRLRAEITGHQKDLELMNQRKKKINLVVD